MSQTKCHGPPQDAGKKKLAEVGKLYLELNNTSEDDNEKRISICNQILKILPTDKDAVAVKAINFIQLGRHEEADKILSAPAMQKAHPFEYAYNQYRQGKVAEAREVLARCKTDDEAWTHLGAQLDYKEENWAAAAAKYRTFLEGSMDEDPDPEMLCNLLACSLNCDPATAAAAVEQYKEHRHFDTSFNIACSLIEGGEWKEANTILQECIGLCKDAAVEMEWDDKQLQDELCILNVQKAYVLQQQGDVSGSKAILEDVLKQKPSSVQATAVAEINHLAVGGARNLFDAYKKIKHVSSGPVDSKLTSKQRLAVRYNHTALLLKMGKVDACRSSCNQLLAQWPASDIGPLSIAALLHREKKYAKAEEVLKSFIEKIEGSDASLRAILSLAQMQLERGLVPNAIQTLSQVHAIESKPGVLAFLVKLYGKTGQIDAAIKLLDSAIGYFERQPVTPATKEKILQLLSKSAEFLAQEKRYEDAVAAYKRALELNPTDSVLISGLVVALASFNPDEAEQYLSKLPGIVDQSSVDALLQDPEALEAIQVPLDPSKVAKKRKAEEGDGPKKVSKKRTKKARHTPKVMDGTADPERWIRLKDRSYYKKLTKKEKAKKQREKAEKEKAAAKNKA